MPDDHPTAVSEPPPGAIAPEAAPEAPAPDGQQPFDLDELARQIGMQVIASEMAGQQSPEQLAEAKKHTPRSVRFRNWAHQHPMAAGALVMAGGVGALLSGVGTAAVAGWVAATAGAALYANEGERFHHLGSRLYERLYLRPAVAASNRINDVAEAIEHGEHQIVDGARDEVRHLRQRVADAIAPDRPDHRAPDHDVDRSGLDGDSAAPDVTDDDTPDLAAPVGAGQPAATDSTSTPGGPSGGAAETTSAPPNKRDHPITHDERSEIGKATYARVSDRETTTYRSALENIVAAYFETHFESDQNGFLVHDPEGHLQARAVAPEVNAEQEKAARALAKEALKSAEPHTVRSAQNYEYRRVLTAISSVKDPRGIEGIVGYAGLELNAVPAMPAATRNVKAPAVKVNDAVTLAGASAREVPAPTPPVAVRRIPESAAHTL